MSEIIYNKLVRDKIPGIILKSGNLPEFRILRRDEYVKCLSKKLIEECHEVLEAKTRGEKLEELADVLEVTRSLVLSLGFSTQDLEEIRLKKFDLRGGFFSGFFLEKVVIKD